MTTTGKRSTVTSVLLLAAVGLLFVIYQLPVWWVSLTAPNYPPEAFPDGVRIHFHLTGVENGCERVEKDEVLEEEALDCVHEMDTINHYVGMYPIASGGVIETTFGPFLFAYMAVLLLGFAIPQRKIRLAVMGAGFAIVAIWMGLAWLGSGGLRYQDADRVVALARSLDQDMEDEEEDAPPSAGEALIAALKASLEGDGAAAAEREEAPAEQTAESDGSAKQAAIESLRMGFERDQAARPASEREEWTGSSAQVLSWHHEKSLRRYFNDPEVVAPMSQRMTTASHALFWLVLLTMPVMLACGWKREAKPFWLLVLLPMVLPFAFIADFAAWLWWYGHNLNEMGAFTLKPFMPTVFGEGKVAQFTTHSYPHVGFLLMLLFTGLLVVAALQRRRQTQAAAQS